VALEEGSNRLAELLDDLSVDILKAWTYFAILLRGSDIDQYEERCGRITEETMDANKLHRLLQRGFTCTVSASPEFLASCTTCYTIPHSLSLLFFLHTSPMLVHHPDSSIYLLEYKYRAKKLSRSFGRFIIQGISHKPE